MIEQLLNELGRSRFYGSLEIKYEAGNVVLIRKTESIKPASEDYRSTRGSSHERN